MEQSGADGRYGRQGGTVCVVQPTIGPAVAFTSGDQVGGVMELKSALGSAGGACILDSLSVIDLDDQKKDLDIFFFSALPTPVSVDNGAINITSADMQNCLGLVSVVAADYVETKAGIFAIACKKNIILEMFNTTTPIGSPSIWAIAVARATPTYTNGLIFKFGIR